MSNTTLPDFLSPRMRTPDFGAHPGPQRRAPLAAEKWPHAAPPGLEPFETAPAPGPMHWFEGMIDELTGYRARWFNTGEVTLYLVEGPCNGPPLLLLPGQIEAWYSYLPALPWLTQRFHVFILEHRGHGFSERAAADRYRVIDYARDAERVIRRVIGAPAFVSGNSLGGIILLALGQHCPEVLRGAFLEDPPYFLVGHPGWIGGWFDRGDFEPALRAMRALQDDNATLAEATRIWADGDMLFPGGESDWPPSFFSTPQRRRELVEVLLCDGPQARVLQRLPESQAAHYLAAFEDFAAHGEVRRKVDYFPLATWDLGGKKLTLTDWNCPNNMKLGIWLEGMSEEEGMRGLTVPTVFWEADRDLVPFNFGPLQTRALELLRDACPKFLHVEAKGSPHEGHRGLPEAYATTLIRFFLD